MISRTSIEVRYAETDQMGVVYHANYLIWFEVSRTNFLKELGYPYKSFEEHGLLSPVLHVEIDYGTPLHYGDTIDVYTKVIETGSVKTVYAYEVYRSDQIPFQDKPCCTGKTTHCLVRKEDFKPVSMKRVAPELMRAYAEVIEPA
ncbi:MAG: acyl-CoA thioesterase [Raoultibacter sp.]